MSNRGKERIPGADYRKEEALAWSHKDRTGKVKRNSKDLAAQSVIDAEVMMNDYDRARQEGSRYEAGSPNHSKPFSRWRSGRRNP
jgi:hypothetical protein